MANSPGVNGAARLSSVPVSKRLSFASYTLDLRSGELSTQGKRIYLQQQPLHVLQMLLERPGEMVGREELRNRLWPSQTFVDFDHGLNKAVQKLRTALGDRSENPQFIETVPRRGYRFIAPVWEIEQVLPEASVKSASHWRNKRSLIIGALTIILLALLSYFGYSARRIGSQTSGLQRLAVLPFKNLGQDAEQEYLIDGIMEEMITRLSRYDPAQLAVISRTSAMAFKKTNKSISQIGRELNVRYILEGSVRREGSHLRVTATLIQVPSETHLWAKTYEGDLRNIASLQNAVADDVAREMKLFPRNSATEHAHTVSPEAYEAFLRGVYLWHTAPLQDIEYTRYFQKAISIEPNYAMAHAWLAFSYNRLASGELRPPSEAYPLAKAEALKAIEIDPNLPEGHAALAFILRSYEWDWIGAEREIQKALQLDPKNPVASHVYGLYLSTLGKHDEAIAVFDKTLDLDPLSPLAASNRALIYANARRDNDAIAARQEFADLVGKEPFWWGHFLLARGANNQALAAFESAPPLNTTLAGRAQAYAALGRTKEARALLKQLEADANARSVLSPYIARIHAALGDQDEAFRWLEIAYSEHAPRLIFLKVDPAWDLLRSDPRFEDLLRRMNLA